MKQVEHRKTKVIPRTICNSDGLPIDKRLDLSSSILTGNSEQTS